MAKVKFSWGIAEMRNKLEGSVFSRNRGGAYIRNKVTPLNPQTSFQTGVRNFFGAISQGWRSLTASQRLAWNQAVSNFIGTDIFGDAKELSGSQLHQKLNLNLKNISEAVITAPPVPGDINSFTSMTVTADTTAGTMNVAFAPAIDAGDKVLLYATAPLSPGISFVKNRFRIITVLDNADVTPFDAAADYIVKFGALPAVGQKIAVKTRIIEKATGLSGIELTDEDIAV